MNRSSSKLNSIACQALLEISKKNLLELFLNQLPSLFNKRIDYIQMISEHLELYLNEFKSIEDEDNEQPLTCRFSELGIPNFLIA